MTAAHWFLRVEHARLRLRRNGRPTHPAPMRPSRVSALAFLVLIALGFAPAHAAAASDPVRVARAYSLHSKVLGATRRIWVYPPAGYSKTAPACDLLLVFDGGVYLTDIPLPRLLDSLTAVKRMPPTVAVLMDNSSGATRLADLANHERFAEFIATELVPWARSYWNVTDDPHRCTIAGSSAGGLAAAFIALRHPELFGNVLSQSGAFWRGAEGSNDAPYEWLTAQYAATSKRDVRFYLDVGSTETRGAIGGAAPSILMANRRLRDALAAKGYAVEYVEVPGGFHAAESWRVRLPAGLVWIAGGRRP
jgi:enterochelin esterase family protein